MSNNEIDNLKLLVSENNTLEFYESYCEAVKDKKSKHYNCIFCGSSDGVSYNKKNNQVKCFSCGESSDIIGLIEKKDKKNFIEALKIACDSFNITHNIDNRETTVESQEEIEARQKQFEENQKKAQAKREAEEKQKQHDQAKAIEKMTAYAPALVDTFVQRENDLQDEFRLLFPNYTDTLQSYLPLYLGYDKKHQSLAIINRLLDGRTFNIKHRQKYVWDDDAKALGLDRMNGKWISWANASTYAFPFEAYKELSQNDDIVVLTEGEKDALNLVALDVNAITLGGVTTSWEDHKDILKDKVVYILFDNDNAGYLNAVKRYKEIESVAKDIFIVLFYHIDKSLDKKYDISDLIIDRKIQTKKEFFDTIAYSRYKITNTLLEDIEDYTGLDLKEYYFNQPIQTVRDIKNLWISKDSEGMPIHITTARGEKDIKGFNEFFEKFKEQKRLKNFNITKDFLIEKLPNKSIQDIENEIEKFQEHQEILEQMISNYGLLHKDYSQQHISDMVDSFISMTRKTDNTFATFNGMLHVWTGTHYHLLDDQKDAIDKFILNAWMPLAHIDKKKRVADNVDTIIKNVKMRSVSLNELKYYQGQKRVLNFLNGTMFINSKGKISFKNIHDKKDGCTNVLNFDYDPNATAPKWQKFLDRVLPNLDDQATLMEYIGYCFLPSHEYESFLFMYGKSGANGKSVIMETISKFFGSGNVSSLNIQDLEGHNLTAIVNKIINIGSELDTKGLNKGQISNLKIMTSTNEPLTINPKNLAPFQLESPDQPKNIFSGNEKPNARDLDGGIFRRMLMLSFDEEILDHEKIRGLSDRFTDEMSGILNLALEQLSNLIARGYFTKSKKLQEQIEDYKDRKNPIRRYIKDCLNDEIGTIVPKDLLFAHYQEYCKEKGFFAKKDKDFHSDILEQMKKVEDIKQVRINVPSHDSVKPRFLANIFVKDDEISSFKYNNREVDTKDINYDRVSKLPLYVDPTEDEDIIDV